MSSITWNTHNRICTVTLNRPDKYNSFDLEMVDEFEAFLQARRYDEETGVIILHGGDTKGFCAGMGFSMAMASDIRILAENARFSAAYINIGLGGADMASNYFLPRLIGAGRAYEYLLTGNWMDAQTASDLGFASRVVPKESMLDEATALAETMVSKNPMAKEAINSNLNCAGLEAALQLEDRNQMMIAYTYRMTQGEQ